MFKLIKYLKKYWYFALLAPLFMVLEVAMDMVLAQYMEKIVDLGIQTKNLDNVIYYGSIMIAVLAAGVIGGILSGVFTNLTAFNFSNDLRKDLFKKIMYLSFEQTDNFQTGSLVTRVTNDITQVQNMISMTLRSLVRALSFFILGIIFTLSISKEYMTILIIILPIEIILLIVFMRLVFPIFTQIQAKLDKVNTIVHENVTGARVVKAFSKEKYEYNRFLTANNEYTGKTLYVNKISALLMPMLMLVVYIASIVIYKIGGDSIFKAFNSSNTDEMIMVGQISQAITYVTMICMSVIMLGMTFTNIARAYASCKRINQVLDEKVNITGGNFVGPTKTRGKIEFKGVSFAYPGSKESILENISFEITPGQTIAIVGSTGCGKSTLVNLMPRFFDTTKGEILIDGVNIKDYSLEVLRKKVSIALQKSELFAGTIKDNVCFGYIGATNDEVNEAIRISQAEEFVRLKEKGLEEYVEEKGTSLSGGQKQRISIARAIIRKPDILIFDDATSALDLVTEAKLYKELKEKMSSTTKIIVAQRIATAKHADKIMVLDAGKIVDFDSHENLMKKCHIYQDIYNSQLKNGGEIYE